MGSFLLLILTHRNQPQLNLALRRSDQQQAMLFRAFSASMASQVSSTESQVARAVRDVLGRVEAAALRASRDVQQVDDDLGGTHS